jgi:glutathione synthase
VKLLFVADPIEELKPKGDSSLVMLRAGLRRRHESYWAVPKDLYLASERVGVNAKRCESCEVDQLPVAGAEKTFFLDEIDAVFIRKDPPFDENYVRLCWLLDLAEKKTFFLNRPSLLARYHEKLIPFEAVVQGFLLSEDLIPTFIGPWAETRDFVEKLGVEEIVLKPFLGFGGTGVAKVRSEDFLSRGNAFEKKWVPQLVQAFCPEISDGDRRVFLLEGKILAHYARIPKEGDFISNLAAGGTAMMKPLSPKAQAALTRLGSFLKSVGLMLAGADLIGDRVSEVNVTSPTGLRSLQLLEGRDYAEEILDFAERSRSSK